MSNLSIYRRGPRLRQLSHSAPPGLDHRGHSSAPARPTPLRPQVQAATINDFTDLIPGVASTVTALQARGIKIGSTTGYSRFMIPGLVEAAKKQVRPVAGGGMRTCAK